jgi:HSP20 family protein
MSERNKLSPEMREQILSEAGQGHGSQLTQQQGEQGGSMQRRGAVPDLMALPAPFRRLSDYMLEMQKEMDEVMSAFGMPTDPFDMFQRVERQMAPMPPSPLAAMERGALRSLTLDVEETPTEYMVHAEVPGFEKDEIMVLLSPEGVLTVQGEKRQEETFKPTTSDATKASSTEPTTKGAGKEGMKEEVGATRGFSRRYAAFKRSVLLPGDVREDGISACVKNGVLTISVPKVPHPEVPKPREIPISAA